SSKIRQLLRLVKSTVENTGTQPNKRGTTVSGVKGPKKSNDKDVLRIPNKNSQKEL
ncbi:hypothetical protein A2U01_0091287, partial [Trifolium medium]|nr:hypothetical protein [Trifolium medium]